MHNLTFEEGVERIVARDPRYHRDAYQFVQEALDFTQETIHRGLPKDAPNKERHVTPKQLLDGIRDFGLKQFGPMALTVFAEWGIHRTDDFGEIVFNGTELFSTTENDSREDFKDVYDFQKVFRQPFLPAEKGTPGTVEVPRPGDGGTELDLKG